jgi:hypothetical protein
VSFIQFFSSLFNKNEAWLFIPEKLNSNLAADKNILLNTKSGFGFHLRAFCQIQTHHGYGHHSILETLSKHSHAASSKVFHILVISNLIFPILFFMSVLETRYRSLCHQLAVKTIIGNLTLRISLSAKSEKMCQWMWFTSTTGFLKCSQSKCATALPTTRDPGNQGCTVTLIKSTLAIFANQILASTFMIFSECSLDAISGTTHQYCWWSSI